VFNTFNLCLGYKSEKNTRLLLSVTNSFEDFHDHQQPGQVEEAQPDAKGDRHNTPHPLHDIATSLMQALTVSK
jgi:hypothetical protein